MLSLIDKNGLKIPVSVQAACPLIPPLATRFVALPKARHEQGAESTNAAGTSSEAMSSLHIYSVLSQCYYSDRTILRSVDSVYSGIYSDPRIF